MKSLSPLTVALLVALALSLFGNYEQLQLARQKTTADVPPRVFSVKPDGPMVLLKASDGKGGYYEQLLMPEETRFVAKKGFLESADRAEGQIITPDDIKGRP